MERFSRYAKAFNEYTKNATIDDKLVKSIEKPAELFLKEKGFDLSTLAGLKAALAWLEQVQPAEAFAAEGHIDDEYDRNMGEGILECMLMIVKAKIQQFVEGSKS